MGVISAVNESVWEHLKLAFWPLIYHHCVVAVVIGQIVSCKIWCYLRISKAFNFLGLAMIIAGALFFAIFTFYPLAAGIFQDSVSGGYGIK